MECHTHLTTSRYGPHLVAEHIEDTTNNRKRIVVLAAIAPDRTGKDKASVMSFLRNRPAELYHVLGSRFRHQVNLMMIESRTAPHAQFEYMFYVDCAGHISDPHMTGAA